MAPAQPVVDAISVAASIYCGSSHSPFFLDQDAPHQLYTQHAVGKTVFSVSGTSRRVSRIGHAKGCPRGLL